MLARSVRRAPYQGRRSLPWGDSVRSSTLTDAAGAFSLTLPEGRYVIRATNVGGYASTASEAVVVSGNPVHITLIVDSGIR